MPSTCTVFTWLAPFRELVCSWFSVLSVLRCVWLAAYNPQEQQSRHPSHASVSATTVIRCPSRVSRQHRLTDWSD